MQPVSLQLPQTCAPCMNEVVQSVCQLDLIPVASIDEEQAVREVVSRKPDPLITCVVGKGW